tara:strand:+ start:341 stop:571 length:231 start_codon:yes stop_codon:yes gene_type:complete
MSKKCNTIYVGETLSLHCQDGELRIFHGDIDDQKLLVMDIEHLFKDLPHIIHLVVEEQKKMQEMYLEMIKESINKL